MARDAEVRDGDSIKLGKIEVRMGSKLVTLTVEQARELSALLKGLFGDDSTKIVHVKDYWYPRPWYVGPSWVYNGSNWNVTSVPSTGIVTFNLTNTSSD